MDLQVVRTVEFRMNTPKCVLGIRIAAYVVITQGHDVVEL